MGVLSKNILHYIVQSLQGFVIFVIHLICKSKFRYKFDDERVTKEDMKRALEEQYGGEEEVILSKTKTASVGLKYMFFWESFGALLQLPHTNPGLNTTPLRFTKHSNAYMLVYIRESDKEKIICDLDEEDISEHLKVLVYTISFIEY